ncbi:MAG: hypothetical protein RI964_1372 [Pseudomonadota bacterium]
MPYLSYLSNTNVNMMTHLGKTWRLMLIVLGSFSLVRLALLLTYKDYFSALDTPAIGESFIHGVQFDASVALTLLLPFILLLNLPLRLVEHQRYQQFLVWSMFVVFIAMLMLLIGDVVYFSYVQRHLAGELFLLKNDAGVIQDMLLNYWWQLIVGAVGCAVLAWGWQQLAGQRSISNRYALWVWLGLLLSLLIIIRGGFDKKPLNVINAYSNGDSRQANLTLNGLFSLVHHLDDETSWANFFSHTTALQQLKLPTDSRYPLEKQYPKHDRKPNIVFILMESWTPSYIDSFSGKQLGITPNYDRLAKEGVQFTQFYAAGQRSIEGIQATLTGVPVFKGVPLLGFGLEVANVTRIGKLAKQRGYETLFLQSSKRGSFYMNKIAASLGFSQYFGMEDMRIRLNYPNPQGSKFGWDYETYMTLFDEIQQVANKPFFAYTFTGSTHPPFARLPAELEKYAYDGKEQALYNLFYYSDWALGEFIDKARQQLWFDNTIFILTADHVYAGQQGDVRESFHIPLVIYAPKLIKPGVNSYLYSQLDILPTLIDLMGIDDGFSVFGESVFKKHTQEAIANQGGIGVIFTDKAYLKHSWHQRLEAQGDPATLDTLEQRLKSIAQVTVELLHGNTWAKD